MSAGFKPVYDENSRVLILGSFPSVKSRKVGFYYGNKQNRFWRMLEGVFNEKIEQENLKTQSKNQTLTQTSADAQADDRQSKINFLLKHNIALFDVVCESDLVGSADSTLAVSNNKLSDISFLLPPNTKVEKIICNGKTAYNFLMKNYKFDVVIVCLSSTSSANPRYNFLQWKEALSFLSE